MTTPDFILTEQHLALLRHAYVRWEDCEYGAPAIDCKRPYGNSSVVADIAEILGVPLDPDADDYGLTVETRERLERLHRETGIALEILLTANRAPVGRYVMRTHGWELGDQGGPQR